MSAADATQVIRNGGKWYKDVTALGLASATAPFGGTALGVAGIGLVQPRFQTKEVTAFDDKFANQAVEALYMGESWLMALELRQWDNDVLATVFPNTAVGGVSGGRVVQKLANSTKPGYRLSNRSINLLFHADDPSNKSLLLYRALPMLDDAAVIQFSAHHEATFMCVFLAIPNTSGNCHQLGTLADLSLTP